MYRWFRYMGAHKALVICGVVLLAAYVFANLGVDISCGPDEILRDAAREMAQETPVGPTTAIPAPTATPVSSARWALAESMRRLDELSSFRYLAVVPGNRLENAGFAVRERQSEISMVSGGRELARVRLILERTYLSEFSGSDEPAQWLQFPGRGALSDLVHVDPGLLMLSGAGFLEHADSEIIMNGQGEVWHLSGLLDPDFVRSLGFSWSGTSSGDYPVQYILGVEADSFIPVSFNFVPYLGDRELRVELFDHDVAGERPAIPAEAVEISSEDTAALAAGILSESRLSGSEEAGGSSPSSADAGAAAVAGRTVAPADREDEGDIFETVAPVGSDGALWVDGPSTRPGWRSYALDGAGVELDLPQTWRMAWTNGRVFLDAGGDIFEVADVSFAESLVGSVSVSGGEFVWGWLAWDALGENPSSFAFITLREYGEVFLPEAAELYMAGTVALNPTVVTDVGRRTFLSDSGVICAMAVYSVSLFGSGAAHEVADCLFASGAGHVGVMVGSVERSGIETILESVK